MTDVATINDGYNRTVVLDCGCESRLNVQPGYMEPKVGDFWPCWTNQHSAVWQYDERTGDPIFDRDRRCTEVRIES